jgi:NAD(P)-dependent dehydrogenase (short-subunit alcohol dehydrogenase family)
MSLPAVLRRAARAPALVRARPRFSRLASTFVPCGEGFAPDATATRAFSSSDARAGGRVSDCAKTVVLADAGHGVGRALLASLLAYPDCRLTVAAATPSADLVASLRNQHWPECEALQCEVSRVDLGDDADVARWRERVLFTHGTPDVVIANVGCMPSRWLRAYGASPSPRDGGDGLGANRRVSDRFAAWRVDAADWSRLMNDVKGVGNVARQFLPAMVQATREEASSSNKKKIGEAFANDATPDEKETKRARGARAKKRAKKKKTRGTRAFVVVSHVVDPPAGATLAPYEASRAALAAVTRALAADLRNVASELDETSRASRNENKIKHANVSEDVSLPYPYGGVVAALVDPGRIPGLALERDGADVGPLHKTHGDARAADWARAAVPFILQMTHEVAGETVHVPGFR